MAAIESSDKAARRPWLRAWMVLLIVVAYLTMTYYPPAWYLPLCGTAVILILARITWPVGWKRKLGLQVSRAEAVRGGVLVLASAPIAYWLIGVAVRDTPILLVPLEDIAPSFRQITFTAGQTLNEEIVLGALLLGGLSRLLPRAKPIHIAMGVAAVFALLHAAFYGLRPESDYNYGRLEGLTLLALLCVGVLRNDMILGSGQIAYAWAIHLGWNLVFFGPTLRTLPGAPPLNEPARFDLVLGDPAVLGVVALGAMVTAFLWRKELLGHPATGPRTEPRLAQPTSTAKAEDVREREGG